MDLVPLVSLSEHLTETKPNEMDNVDSEEEAVNYDNPMYNAKTCLEFISTLNGHDDIGVFLRGEGKMLLRMPSDPHHWVMWESVGCRCHTH